MKYLIIVCAFLVSCSVTNTETQYEFDVYAAANPNSKIAYIYDIVYDEGSGIKLNQPMQVNDVSEYQTLYRIKGFYSDSVYVTDIEIHYTIQD